VPQTVFQALLANATRICEGASAICTCIKRTLSGVLRCITHREHTPPTNNAIPSFRVADHVFLTASLTRHALSMLPMFLPKIPMSRLLDLLVPGVC